ncbi:MAG: type II secretion system protein M [Pseudomonadales bacterium]|nr:type II secretion system protein M [Pseudomonadales bacterium]
MDMQWFHNLEKREQFALIGCVVVVVIVSFWSFYMDLHDQREMYNKRNQKAESTLIWLQQAVSTIQSNRGSGGSSSAFANKSLSQLSELAAKRSNLRFSRFQPKGDNEAQVWFDKVEFSQLLDFLARLELDYSVHVETMSINSANAPGIVNARIKFSK